MITTYISPPGNWTGRWRKGQPPAVGWWPASSLRTSDMLRFWNGEFWSVGTPSRATAEQAARVASKRDHGMFEIEWTDRWWEKKA